MCLRVRISQEDLRPAAAASFFTFFGGAGGVGFPGTDAFIFFITYR